MEIAWLGIQNPKVGGYLLLAFATLAGLFFSSISLALYLYTPEVYPTRMRALGSSIASGWLRVASVVGPLVIGTVIAHYTL